MCASSYWSAPENYSSGNTEAALTDMKLEVAIQKSLRAQDRVFELDVKFQTAKDLIVIFGSSGTILESWSQRL